MLDPQTACTFLLLKATQLLSLQSKLSLYDYYIHLEQLTDMTGTTNVNVSQVSCYFKMSWLTSSKVQYKAFLRTLCVWRHIRMVKCGGQSYNATGINGTSPGKLAVLCLACPIPSRGSEAVVALAL